MHVDRESMAAKVWLHPVCVAYNLGYSRHELRKTERLIETNRERCPRAGERIAAVRLSDDSLAVDLLDGRTLIVPLAWYPRLLHASVAERDNFRIIGGGYVINWPDVDEHLSSQGLLAGAPAPNAMSVQHAG